MTIIKKTMFLLVTMHLAVTLGCARENTPNAVGPNGVFQPAGEHNVSQRVYHLDPPDEILITCPGVKELNGEKVVIDPTGKITLPLLGEVQVAGMTEAELKAKLTNLTSKYYNDPVLRVVVTDNSKYIYMFGLGGTRQGKFPYNGRVTVLTALADAGFTVQAWPEQVRISRPARDGNANATVVVNFGAVWQYGDLSQNYLLEEGDIIFIPLTPLSEWNIDANQLLQPLVSTAALVTFGPSVAGSVK
jgi:polysaccharide export outer membrane protein